MKDITLISVNWNTRRVMELMLKSYALHHSVKNRLEHPLNLMLVDNGSTDDSKQWLTDNEIPFIDLPVNIGHEAAINAVYKKITTRYALLVDTDIEFKSNCYLYTNWFMLIDKCIAAGDLITGDNLGYAIKQRLGAWFILFDINLMRDIHDVRKFRDTNLWNYDTGSWFTEKLFELGYNHYQINREPGDIDRDVVGMRYPTHDHLGKCSWATSHHKDRIDEIAMRKKYVEERLKEYEHIDLRNKFI